MKNNRLHTRMNCKSPCQLYWNGSPYPATIKNLSVVAMCLNFDGARPDVKIGDDCVISFNYYKKTDPYKFNYQVIRINASDIAVGFITPY